MKTEPINAGAQAEMERQLGCRFCPDGRFAEMSLPLADYREQTAPIPGVSFGFYTGEPAPLQALVAQVDDSWCRYYTDTSAAFCAWVDGQVVSFCLVDTDAACILSLPGLRVGSIGCVGTLPAFRGRGIGLRMVDLATQLLRQAGCDKSYISYTAIDHWYARLGYQVFARFSFL